MRVNDNLPNTPEEVSSEYLKRRKELKELEDNPVQTGNRMNAVLAEVPRLRAIEEAAYQPSEGEYGIITEPIFDDDGEFLGVIQDIDDPYLTAQEKLARKEVNRLRERHFWLRNRLQLLRIKAAARGTPLSPEDVEIDTIKLKPGRKADPKVLKRGQIVRKHIHTKKDFFDEEKKQVLLREFEENEIPLPKDRYGLLKYPGRNWQEIMSQSAKWEKVVDDILNRDRFPRESKITTE